MTLDQFITQNIGKKIDFDGAFGAQCMDLYRFYVRDVWGKSQTPKVIGAYQVFDTIGAGYEKIKVGNGIPRKGDVICWSEGIGKNGHIGIITEATETSFKVFQQNAPISAPCNIGVYNYKYIIGWFRPKQIVNPTPMTIHKIGVLLSHIEDETIVKTAIKAVQDRVALLGDIRIEVDYQVTTAQFHTESGVNTVGQPVIYASPTEIGVEGRKMEVSLGKEFDLVSLIYDPAFVIGTPPTNPVENPVLIEGFNINSIPENWYKNTETGEVFIDSLIQFFYHEMLHAWFYIVNRENPTAGVPDTVHTYGGVTGPGHPTAEDILNDFDSKVLSLKPWWPSLANNDAGNNMITRQEEVKVLRVRINGVAGVMKIIGGRQIEGNLASSPDDYNGLEDNYNIELVKQDGTFYPFDIDANPK